VNFIQYSVQKTGLIYTVSQKNDTAVAHYNFDPDQPILIIFNTDVAERAHYQTAICYPTFPSNASALCLFSHAVYSFSETKWLGQK